MKKFLFITHISPQSIRSVLRERLIEIMHSSLLNQSYKNWKALWIGEEEKELEKIKIVAVKSSDRQSVSREVRALYSRKDVIDFINDCDYVTKLDDDDVISYSALERASTADFDCYCDLYHTFYDVSSGIITRQKRSWIPSTALHKKEHAFKKLGSDESSENLLDSLFYGEHGEDWIKYYRNKKIVHADRRKPLYLRILSPTSYTAGASLSPVLSFADVNMENYYRYLKTFGTWNRVRIKGFENYMEPLNKTWKEFSGSGQVAIQGIPYFKKIKDFVKDKSGW